LILIRITFLCVEYKEGTIMCQGDFGEILSRRYQKNVPAMVGEVRPTFEKEGLLTKEIIKRRCKFKGGLH
jgi:hypothetical protein